MAAPNGTIPVYNVAVAPYSAVGNGTTNNTAAFTSAINDIQGSGAPGILYIPPSTGGFLVSNGSLTISSPNIILLGAGGMGIGFSGGDGPSTIIGTGSGDTIKITGSGCEVRGLTFAPSGAQSGSYLNISGDQCRVSNVNMESPHIGISLSTSAGGGNFWIEEVLMGGTFGVGGMNVNCGGASVVLRHVIMYNNSESAQPSYGILVVNAGELVIYGGTDIDNMGNCLQIAPGQGQAVGTVFVSDSLFDSGNGAGCVLISPSGNGFVQTVRFANVWTSTGTNTGNPTNGFTFNALGSTAAKPIEDVSLVNCIAQGFTGHDGLFAAGVDALSVIGSTFSGNFNGIEIYPGMSNFILNGNKCGAYAFGGGNSNYGIAIDNGSSDYYIITSNLLHGNTVGGLYDGGTGTHKSVVNNVT